MSTIRSRIAMSPFASMAALPGRIRLVARHDAKVIKETSKWLVRSREHTNLTYHLTPLSQEYLSWFVAGVTGQPLHVIKGFMGELEQDTELASHIERATTQSGRRRLADPTPRYGRRLGCYALVRALQPECVVETGTDKGLNACAVAAALLRNGHGRLTTIDINADAGYLIGGRYAEVVDLRVANSLDVLPSLIEPIDLFFHEVHGDAEQEGAEYRAIEPRLTEHSVLLTENAESNAELSTWAESCGWRLSYFHERPANHWYPGAGMCAAIPNGSTQLR